MPVRAKAKAQGIPIGFREFEITWRADRRSGQVIVRAVSKNHAKQSFRKWAEKRAEVPRHASIYVRERGPAALNGGPT